SFNNWDGREHPMRQLGVSGVWEIFMPGVGAGEMYKFLILGADGFWHEKADPMAFQAQIPPDTASVITSSSYSWSDEDWMRQRTQTAPISSPMSVYEVHLASWRRGRTYEQLADELVAYLQELNFTHVEFMPVMQHPFGGSWGYHVTSYFAPDSRLGHPDGLRLLIDRLHQAGIGVILDWVPGHFATDPWALVRFDGTPLYEDPNPQRGWHPEWGSWIFNFGRPEVRNFLYANAVYWATEFHADGLRVDGVASMLYLDYARKDGEWTPNIHGGHENLEAVQFLQEMNATLYRRCPGVVTIAEESTSWPGVTKPTDQGGLGFGFKWNMGWMHDSLGYLAIDPMYRAHHHGEMTFSLVYAYSENYVLPISHDEVVHG
ncbi:MAG TPA: 1,4-alpha-glucan branching enzyme, partial [Marmoricola sp.]|nr:1,4-alpha-glucan branching enzyme [Marmoricola sp.]